MSCYDFLSFYEKGILVVLFDLFEEQQNMQFTVHSSNRNHDLKYLKLCDLNIQTPLALNT